MKQQWRWLPLAVACLSCGGPDSGTKGDVEGSGGGNQIADARMVTGTHTLTVDTKYDKLCNYLDETFVASIFDAEGISVKDSQNGCEFSWDGKRRVIVSTNDYKPFASMYHAEYYFDSLYQPMALAARRQTYSKPSLFGPGPQGYVVERPTVGQANYTTVGMGLDSSAANDTAMTYSRVPASAAKLTQDPMRGIAGVPVPGIGDKAIWNAAKHTLHILYLHHVIHIMVDNGTPATDLKQAQQMALVVLEKITDESQGGIETGGTEETK